MWWGKSYWFPCSLNGGNVLRQRSPMQVGFLSVLAAVYLSLCLVCTVCILFCLICISLVECFSPLSSQLHPKHTFAWIWTEHSNYRAFISFCITFSWLLSAALLKYKTVLLLTVTPQQELYSSPAQTILVTFSSWRLFSSVTDSTLLASWNQNHVFCSSLGPHLNDSPLQHHHDKQKHPLTAFNVQCVILRWIFWQKSHTIFLFLFLNHLLIIVCLNHVRMSLLWWEMRSKFSSKNSAIYINSVFHVFHNHHKFSMFVKGGWAEGFLVSLKATNSPY